MAPVTAILTRLLRGEDRRGCSEEEKVENEVAEPPGGRLEARRTVAQPLPALWFGQVAPHGVQRLRLVQEPRRCRSLISHPL